MSSNAGRVLRASEKSLDCELMLPTQLPSTTCPAAAWVDSFLDVFKLGRLDARASGKSPRQDICGISELGDFGSSAVGSRWSLREPLKVAPSTSSDISTRPNERKRYGKFPDRNRKREKWKELNFKKTDSKIEMREKLFEKAADGVERRKNLDQKARLKKGDLNVQQSKWKVNWSSENWWSSIKRMWWTGFLISKVGVSLIKIKSGRGEWATQKAESLRTRLKSKGQTRGSVARQPVLTHRKQIFFGVFVCVCMKKTYRSFFVRLHWWLANRNNKREMCGWQRKVMIVADNGGFEGTQKQADQGAVCVCVCVCVWVCTGGWGAKSKKRKSNGEQANLNEMRFKMWRQAEIEKNGKTCASFESYNFCGNKNAMCVFSKRSVQPVLVKCSRVSKKKNNREKNIQSKHTCISPKQVCTKTNKDVKGKESKKRPSPKVTENEKKKKKCKKMRGLLANIDKRTKATIRQKNHMKWLGMRQSSDARKKCTTLHRWNWKTEIWMSADLFTAAHRWTNLEFQQISVAKGDSLFQFVNTKLFWTKKN